VTGADGNGRRATHYGDSEPETSRCGPRTPRSPGPGLL